MRLQQPMGRIQTFGLMLLISALLAADTRPVDPSAIPLERISFQRATGDGGRFDWSADGSKRRQVTYFNKPGSSDFKLVDGLWSMPSDNAWNPHPPAGKEELLLYLQVDFKPLQNVSVRNEIFLIEFTRTTRAGKASQ